MKNPITTCTLTPPPPTPHPKKTQQNETKRNKKIVKLSTVMPELVTRDCSLTHVLQVPNAQPYHS